MQKTYPDNTAVNYTCDNDSRLIQVTDPTGTYQFTFDNMGRLTAATTQYTFLTGRNFTAGYSYDAASNRTGFTDPENGATSYVYDTLNRLQTLTLPAAFSGTGNFGFSYDALSRRTQMTRPNGLKSVYAYDNLSRLLSVLHQSGSTTLDGASYTVDNAGNRATKTDQLAGATSNYTYDPIYELTQVTQGANTTESYTYDPVGNRLSSLGVSPYSNNASNELTSIPGTTYTYDNNGNTATKVDTTGTTSYAWDFENRLSSVTLPGSGGTVSFKYDPFGRRTYKSSSSGTSVFAYDGDNLIEETNSSGAAFARYAQTQNIDEPLAMLRSAATSYYHADGLGSISSLSNAAGTIANTYTYDSFGKLTNSTGSLVNPFRYTARESDTETGLYYYRARYYDPLTGRFLSEDPKQLGAGINYYSYAGNHPTVAVDPLGLDYTVSVGPGGITINASITLYGPNATSALAANWQKVIQNVWNNNPGYRGCKVSFNVQVIADPGANHWWTARNNSNFPRSAQNQIYPTTDGETGVRNNSWGSWWNLASDAQIAHEAGHLFDLGDYYWDTPKGNVPLPGFEGDIMTDTGTVNVSQWDINVIVGLKKPNFCGCKQ